MDYVMTKIKLAPLEQELQSAGRQEYARPRLKDFGSVGALTQGGTAGVVEQPAGMGAQQNPNRMA